MTTISVIVPAYNAERTILATIESVLQQSFKDLELIAIDDGSGDRTLELLSTIADERLKVHSYQNGGLPTARNRGISLAQGNYITFIDADDIWTPDKLDKQLAALKANPQASVVYSWYAVMLGAGTNHQQSSLFPGKKASFTGNVYTKLLEEYFIGNGSNILATKEAIESTGMFDPKLKSCEDWEYCIRLAAKHHFTVVPEYQVLYRKSSGAMTSNGAVIEREGLKVIERVYQTVPPQMQYLKARSIAIHYRYCGKIYIDCSDRPKDIELARNRLLEAIALNPLLLLSTDTYILLFKILLKQFLPPKIVRGLIYVFKKPFEMKRFPKTL